MLGYQTFGELTQPLAMLGPTSVRVDYDGESRCMTVSRGRFTGRKMQNTYSVEWALWLYWEPSYPSQSSGLFSWKEAKLLALVSVRLEHRGFLRVCPLAELRVCSAGRTQHWRPAIQHRGFVGVCPLAKLGCTQPPCDGQRSQTVGFG